MDSFAETTRFEEDCWKQYIRGFIEQISEYYARYSGNRPEQQKAGGSDVLMRPKGGEERWVEIKCERRFTGNLFLETWSNRAFKKEIQQKPGWMVSSTADTLLYFFADVRRLFNIDMKRLQSWFYSTVGGKAAFEQYVECVQSANPQRNITCGRLVPISDIASNVGLIEYRLNDNNTFVVVNNVKAKALATA